MTRIIRYRSSPGKDKQIHEALLLGHSPAEVAAQFNCRVDQVLAANRRVEAEREAMSPEQADIEAQRTALRAIFRASIQSFHQRVEETTTVSKESNGKHRVTRTVKNKLPDPRLLKTALSALEQECNLLRLDEAPPPSQTAGNAIRAAIDAQIEQSKKYPELFDDMVHAQLELAAGQRLPRIDMNDPRLDPPPPRNGSS